MYKPFFSLQDAEETKYIGDSLNFEPNLLMLNINTINSDKLDQLLLDIEQFPSICILCLVEIGVRRDMVHTYRIDGYRLISYYCRPTLKCGGVGIWVRNDLESREIDVSSFCIEQHFEVCGIFLNCCDFQTIILNCYRSPCGDESMFINSVETVLDHFYRPNVNILICGDTNFDMFSNNHYETLCNIVSCFNMKNAVGWPTRVTDTSCTLIDQVFHNFNNDGICVVLDNCISDHRTVMLEMKLKNNNSSQLFSDKRFFTEDAISQFSDALFGEGWQKMYESEDLNLAFNHFYSIFLYHFEIYFPKRKCRYTTQNKNWVSGEVRQSSIKLKDLHVLKKIYPELNEMYSIAKQKHGKLVNSTKKKYYQNQISKISNPVTAAWKIVADISDKNKNRKEVVNLMVENNGIVVDKSDEVASLFNDFFITQPIDIVNELRAKPHNSTKNVESIKSVDRNVCMYLVPFAEDELYSLLTRKLNTKKSAGADEVPTFLLKRVLISIIQPLTYLVNLSFVAGAFPDALKLGRVTPLHKGGSRLLMKNYRPVTVSQSLSKVFEYSFLDRLMKYINRFNILSAAQHGYQSGRSTMTAIDSFYNCVVQYMEGGDCPVGIFFDLSRAFDCVSHARLLDLLWYDGIRGVANMWLDSYLKDRQQYVVIPHKYNNYINAVASGTATVQMGVPQGSVLGPVLFLLYVNKVATVFDSTFSVMFADDLSAVVTGTSDDVLNKCEKLIGDVNTFFSTLNLKLNIEKTHMVRFHSSQKQCDELKLSDNVPVTVSTSVRFLGMYFDECLGWKSHAGDICGKLCQAAYLFKNLRTVLTGEQLVNIYYAYVECRLRYGVCYWGNAAVAKVVFIAQKRVLRSMAGVPGTYTCRNLFKQFNILPLPSLYVFEMCVYVYRTRNSFKLTSECHGVNTRNKNKYYIPFARLNISKNLPNCIGLKIFDHLPSDIRNIETLSRFKCILKKFLIVNCFYSLTEYFEYGIH